MKDFYGTEVKIGDSVKYRIASDQFIIVGGN